MEGGMGGREGGREREGACMCVYVCVWGGGSYLPSSNEVSPLHHH